MPADANSVDSPHHADKSAFAGRVIAVKSFTTLAASRADEHNVPRRTLPARVRFHLGDGVLHQSKHGIKIDSQR